LKRKPLVEFASLPEKRCQNDQFTWHRYPNTHHKKRWSDDQPSNQTFVVLIKKTKKVGIFCYHCFLDYLGRCTSDLKKAGATKEEISDWLFPLPNKGLGDE